MKPLRFYGTECSLYSGKTRAYLRYKNIPFEEILSTTDVYRKIILPRVKRPIIPVVITPEDETLQDTTVIIDALEERFPEPSVYPDTPLQRLVALLFEVYGDEWLVMPAMHYRWHFKRQNLLFILREFGGTMKPELPRFLHAFAGIPPALMFGNLYKPYFGITRRASRKAVERSYLGFLAEFEAHLESSPYLLGNRPSIGDYGLIAPLYAHLYRDPYPGKLMRKKAPRVARWVERVEAGERPDGDFLPDDTIPETLYPLLKRIFREQGPVLIDTFRAVAEWHQSHPDRRHPPRIIGEHDYTLEGVTAKRKIQPFAQWMGQRPVLFYQSLSEAERKRVHTIMEPLGGVPLLEAVIEAPVEYVKHKVTFR